MGMNFNETRSDLRRKLGAISASNMDAAINLDSDHRGICAGWRASAMAEGRDYRRLEERAEYSIGRAMLGRKA